MTNKAHCVKDLDKIVEIFLKFTKLQVETHESAHRIRDGPLAGERLCRYIDLILHLRSIPKLPCRGNQFTEFNCDNVLCQK